jgi:hypothetical protein
MPTLASQHEMTQVLIRAFEHNHQDLISISSSDEDLTRNYQDYNTTSVKA